MVLVVACSSDDDRKPAGTGLFGGAGGGTAGSGGSGGTSAAGSAGAAGQAGEAGAGGMTSDAGDAGDVDVPDADKDAGSDAPIDVVVDVVLPLDPCPNATSAVGFQALMAGGPTPKDFATAYNDEVATMSEPGPMVLEFTGLDVVDPAEDAWDLRFGAAQPAGSEVAFLGTPAIIPFEFSTNRNVIVPFTEADFELHFDTPTTQVDIPAVSIMTAGEFDPQCSTLMLEGVEMIIPDTAGSLEFHGSTLADLLGAPNADCCGGAKNAWSIMLAGTAQPVQVQ